MLAKLERFSESASSWDQWKPVTETQKHERPTVRMSTAEVSKGKESMSLVSGMCDVSLKTICSINPETCVMIKCKTHFPAQRAVLRGYGNITRSVTFS